MKATIDELIAEELHDDPHSTEFQRGMKTALESLAGLSVDGFCGSPYPNASTQSDAWMLGVQHGVHLFREIEDAAKRQRARARARIAGINSKRSLLSALTIDDEAEFVARFGHLVAEA
jgi:hypothetical protein